MSNISMWCLFTQLSDCVSGDSLHVQVLMFAAWLHSASLDRMHMIGHDLATELNCVPQDLLLAMLVSNEPLRLAFNSAHVAPLLSGTRQSTFPARPPNPLAQTASVIPGSNQGPLPMQPSQIPQLQSADMAAAAATAAAQPSGTSQAQASFWAWLLTPVLWLSGPHFFCASLLSPFLCTVCTCLCLYACAIEYKL